MPTARDTTIHEVLAQAGARLAAVGSGRIDAELLLAAVLDVTRTQLRAWPEKPVTTAQASALDSLLTRRAAGEPVAYLLERHEFWSLPLRVTSATLVPRPETELLVDMALARIPRDRATRVADLGTGSGAIALALAHERPLVQIVATDRSHDALDVAIGNAAGLKLNNVRFIEGDWFAPLAGQRFHVIVSNPPYVADNDPHLQNDGLRFEPRTALVADDNGLADLRAIIASAQRHLESGGALLLEHGYSQGHAVRTLLADHGYRDIETVKDGAGIERVTMAALKEVTS